MDLDALLTIVFGGYVVVQSLRALAWLINLPRGAVLDAMLGSEVAGDNDLQERSPARRNRYRELRR